MLSTTTPPAGLQPGGPALSIPTPNGTMQAVPALDAVAGAVLYTVTGPRLKGVFTLAAPARHLNPFERHDKPADAVLIMGRDDAPSDHEPAARSELPEVNGIRLCGLHWLRRDDGHFWVMRAGDDGHTNGDAPPRTSATVRTVARALLEDWLSRDDLDALQRAAARRSAPRWITEANRDRVRACRNAREAIDEFARTQQLYAALVALRDGESVELGIPAAVEPAPCLCGDHMATKVW